MKFKPIHAIPCVFALFATAANAEAPEFTQADKDKDGKLSIEEARSALPELEIRDENGDGVVNYAEAKSSVEGLQLPASSQANEQSAPVGMSEYRLLVQAMERNGSDA